MQEPLPETPGVHADPLLTGHFHERGAYRTWRTRGTNDYLLIYTVSGQGRFGSENGAFVANAGDAVLLLPGARHDYGTAAPNGTWELLWTHFHPRPHWHEWLRWPLATPGLLRLTLLDPLLRQKADAALRAMHRQATGAGRNRDAFAMNSLEEALLWCDAARPRAALDARVQTAMDFLCGQMGRSVSLNEAAKASGLSGSRLAHLFKAEVGQTVGQFLEAQRLERARRLLARTDLPVQSVAADVGYESAFYFTQRFKKATGLSPTDHRRRARLEEDAQSMGE